MFSEDNFYVYIYSHAPTCYSDLANTYTGQNIHTIKSKLDLCFIDLSPGSNLTVRIIHCVWLLQLPLAAPHVVSDKLLERCLLVHKIAE